MAKSGFTLVEILVVIALLVLIGGIIIGSLGQINRREALAKETANLVSLLNQARALTLASKNSSEYGLHLAVAQVTLFRGLNYDASASTNEVTSLNPLITIASYTLTGGGSNIIFDRLTGTTAESGTITLALVADVAVTKTITVSVTGVVEIN